MPLNDTIISTMTYYMRDSDDIDMVTVFATKIGQSTKMDEVKSRGESRLG